MKNYQLDGKSFTERLQETFNCLKIWIFSEN
jgi:hypothetical protein